MYASALHISPASCTWAGAERASGLGEVQCVCVPLAVCICYCSRGPVSLCGDSAAVLVCACCGQRAACRGAWRGGSRCGWVSARLEPGLAIRRSSAELWELVPRGEERGGDRTGQMAALSWKGVPKPAPSKGRKGGPQALAAGLGCGRKTWHACDPGCCAPCGCLCAWHVCAPFSSV